MIWRRHFGVSCAADDSEYGRGDRIAIAPAN
jgi:hypothetical protein